MYNFEINRIVWTILFVPWNNFNLYRDNGSLTVGMCDSKTKTIYISDKVAGEFLFKVLVHEVTHAFVFSYKLNSYKLDCEERVADIIASYGASILATTEKIWEAIN